jgi:DHA3 family macrolide efflux protein-like MFS transporter
MREVLRIPTMRRLWYAQIVSNFGDFLALFAVIGVLTFKLHATAQQVTGVQIAYLLPIAVLGILAGVFVDRWPLKRTLVSSDVIRGFLCLLCSSSTQIWHFYASSPPSASSPASSARRRASSSAKPSLPRPALLQRPHAAGHVHDAHHRPRHRRNAGRLLRTKVCYWLDAASFFASASFIASTAIQRSAKAVHKHTAAEDKGAIAKVWHDMKQGMNFILHHAALLFVILAMSAGMFVIGCFGPLIAVYVRDSLHANTTVYGWASAP